jgi:hypothetical protein
MRAATRGASLQGSVLQGDPGADDEIASERDAEHQQEVHLPGVWCPTWVGKRKIASAANAASGRDVSALQSR